MSITRFSINECVLVFQTHSHTVRVLYIMFNLLCYVRGDDYKHAFIVKIEEEEAVATLKEAINLVNPSGQNDFASSQRLLAWYTKSRHGYTSHGLHHRPPYCSFEESISLASHQSIPRTRQNNFKPLLLTYRFFGGISYRNGYVLLSFYISGIFLISQ